MQRSQVFTDDRMFALNRQGRAPFVVGSSGHEAIQVASVGPLDAERDWIMPYYRDMGVALAWGIPVLDVFLAVFAKKSDPMSGGRFDIKFSEPGALVPANDCFADPQTVPRRK